MTFKDSIGDRMKEYEAPSTMRKAFKGQPLVVRLDGCSFHKFTKGMQRPFDKTLSDLMIDTMRALVQRYQANIGYTQSDEISLGFYIESDSAKEFDFGGRFQKFESEMAAWCSVKFNDLLRKSVYADRANMLPYFDARAFVVPNLLEAYHAFLWRQQDCTKNAISMAAQSMFPNPKDLHGKHGPEMQEMMFKEHGVNFNDYPAFFKRGTFARRETLTKFLGEQELLSIPEQHRPTGPVLRTEVITRDIWLSKQENPVQTLFKGGIITPA